MKTRLSAVPVIFILALCRIASAGEDAASAPGAVDPHTGQASPFGDPGAPAGLPGDDQDIYSSPDINPYDTNPKIADASTEVYEVGLTTGIFPFGPDIYIDYTPAIFGDATYEASVNAPNTGGAKRVFAGFYLNQHEAGLIPEDAKVTSPDAYIPADFNLSEAEAATIPGLTEAIPEPGVCAMVFLGIAVLALSRTHFHRSICPR